MTQLRAGYDGQAVREPIERANPLTAPEGRKVTNACGSSASGRGPPHRGRRNCRMPGLGSGITPISHRSGRPENPIGITRCNCP
jgi:hypothetical protein